MYFLHHWLGRTRGQVVEQSTRAWEAELKWLRR